MNRLSLLLTFVAFAAAIASGRDTRTGVNNPAFSSLRVEVLGVDQAPPVITLGAADHIVISFDELADDRRYMRYELLHCDADWNVDNLVDSEFLDGFNQADVDRFDYSRATLVHYVHYSIVLPNEQMRFTVSGNYLLRVYPEDDPDLTLLQARFSVTEQAVAVAGSVSTTTDIDNNSAHQQLALTVDPGSNRIDDPFNRLRLVIVQNGRDDTRRVISHPLRMVGSKAVYEHQRDLIFPAGNEYRRMEIISTTIPTMRIADVAYIAPLYHAAVDLDLPRAGSMYLYDSTQHGRWLPREANSTSPDTEADYIATLFSLEAPAMPGRDVYIDGDLTNRRLDPTSRMDYNHDTGRYEKTLLLKQGAYNYQYVTRPAGDSTAPASTAAIEGDFAPTVNEYTVMVYYRAPGDRYDRLLGTALLTNQ